MPLSSQLIDLPYRADSSDYFKTIHDLPFAIWLDSAGRGRYDIMAADPDTWLISHQGVNTLKNNTGFSTISHGSPFPLLAKMQKPNHHSSQVPFSGGLMGYFGYDIGRNLETLPATILKTTSLPDMQVGHYEWALIQDHQEQKTYFLNSSTESAHHILKRLADTSPIDIGKFSAPAFVPSTSINDYERAFLRIQQYIHAGDCYQVNLSQHFSADYLGEPLAAYLAIRKSLPSPFGAFFNTPSGSILSASPERFIQVTNNKVVTQPIKGTIRRGNTPAEDTSNAAYLQNSVKDRAENLMIVDLLRNDLSKVCSKVVTHKLFDLESYANVHHLVSTIHGDLKAGLTPLDVLQASFPGGSITGAPKIRAMEIIEELEPVRRSVYCGSIGYISDNGNMDTNIAIRTLICDGEQVHCWGGGGIVADSQCATEYNECLEKIDLLIRTLQQLSL